MPAYLGSRRAPSSRTPNFLTQPGAGFCCSPAVGKRATTFPKIYRARKAVTGTLSFIALNQTRLMRATGSGGSEIIRFFRPCWKNRSGFCRAPNARGSFRQPGIQPCLSRGATKRGKSLGAKKRRSRCGFRGPNGICCFVFAFLKAGNGPSATLKALDLPPKVRFACLLCSSAETCLGLETSGTPSMARKGFAFR